MFKHLIRNGNIEISLILNGYSPKFIISHFKKFFHKHNALSTYKELDSENYQQLHELLLAEPTKSKGHKNQQNQPKQQQQQQPQTEKTNEKVPIKQKQLILHYRFESGPLSKFNGEFRKLWEKHFCYEKSSLNSLRLILGTRSNPSLDRLLVKKKPASSLLTQLDKISETVHNPKPTAMDK
jgi:hypothetical protein